MEYLSDEWATALTSALAQDAEFLKVARKRRVTLAVEVNGSPQGDVVYHIGTQPPAVRFGRPETADVTFSGPYDVWAQLAAGQLDGRDVFMRRQVRTDVGLMRTLKFSSIMAAFGRAQRSLDLTFPS